MRGIANPAVAFLIVLAIGIVAGIIYDRIAGPGWLTRQFAGSTRGMVTSALIGIAGSFIGFHLAALAGLVGAIVAYVAAAVGAAVVLWAWRTVR
jgi:uncharacterized membrane protein YeaQ/YmgE (transglycosylase-associated protein family)